MNLSVPMFRTTFQPFQSHSSSTSEENRQRSIARVNSKPKQRARTIKPKREIQTPEPVNVDLAVLLFPVNVYGFLII